MSEDTYIEQGEYWEKLYHPLIKYVLDKYKPDLAMVGYPVTDEVQHQFLGLVTKQAAQRRRTTRPTTTSTVDGTQGRPRQAARALHPRGLRGLRRDDAARAGAHARPRPDDVRRLRPRLRAAVPGHRREQGARRPRPAVDARRPATAGRADGRDDRQGQGLLRGRRRCRSTSTSSGRDPAPPAPRARRSTSRSRRPTRRRDGRADQGRVPRAQGHQRLDRRRQARELEGHRPHLHQGRGALHPERRRAARPTWRTRPARATWSCSPTRRTSSTRRRRAR